MTPVLKKRRKQQERKAPKRTLTHQARVPQNGGLPVIEIWGAGLDPALGAKMERMMEELKTHGEEA